MTVGRLIKMTRLRNYSSQKKFAVKLGVHETSVANAETGSERVGGKKVFPLIEDALGWPVGSISDYINGRSDLLPSERQPASETRSLARSSEAPHEWSAAFREKIAAMALDEIVDLGKTIGEADGEDTQIRFLRAALQIKDDQRGTVPAE